MGKTPAHKSIGVRIFILILAMVVPLAAFGLYNTANEKKRWTAEISGDLSASTREAKNKINDLIDASKDLLAGLSETDGVLGNNHFSCTRVLANVAKRFTKYTNFSKVDANKFIVCSSGPLPQPKDVSKSPNIIEAFETGAFSVSPFKFGVLTGKPVLVFSMPLIGDTGEVVGTVNNGLSLTWLGEYLSGISQHTNQRMAVFDGQGRVMASHPHDLYEVGANISKSELGVNVLGMSGGAKQFSDENGDEWLLGISRISRVPGGAYIAALVPLEPLLAETTRGLYVHLGLLLGLAGASLVFGWIGARLMVLDPIDRLSEFAGRVEEGDFSARSGIAYDSGELGKLAQAYDRMIAALDARTSALKDSEANYRELVESEKQLIHRYLPDTTEVFVNQALADFTGVAPDDLIGRKWIDYAAPEERHVIEGFLSSRTLVNPTYVYEHTAINSKGETRWLRWNNHAFFDDYGNITHFQAVAVDLTDRKAVERNLEVAMMEARAANLAKSNFLANMSHELRTPLNSIIGFSEMMSSGIMGKLSEKHTEYASFITSSGHHLLNIINDILDLSKIEAGMLTLDESVVNLGQEVAEVVMMLREQGLKNDNQLHNKLDRSDTFTLTGDRMRIKQVLLNLIGNAVKFTEGGEVVVDAHFDDEGGVVLAVRDTGIGMTADEVELALSLFGQVDGQHLNKRFEGTGLGLPLAEQLMEMHGGTLEIESVKGEGTTVKLNFPPSRTR